MLQAKRELFRNIGGHKLEGGSHIQNIGEFQKGDNSVGGEQGKFCAPPAVEYEEKS